MAQDPQPRSAKTILGPEPQPLALLGVPVQGAALPSRAELAPAVIRRALARYNSFDLFSGEQLAAASCFDLGNLTLGTGRPEQDNLIKTSLVELRRDSPLIDRWIFIGGSNSLTSPCCQGLFDDLGAVGLLALSGHDSPDLAGRPATQRRPIDSLIEAGLPGENISQIGLGRFAISAADYHQAQRLGVEMVDGWQLSKQGLAAVIDEQINRLSGRVDYLYLSINPDLLDRSLTPACPGARPGGIDLSQLFDGLAEALSHRRLVAADIVEFDPSRDLAGQTALTAAQILLTLISGFLARDTR